MQLKALSSVTAELKFVGADGTPRSCPTALVVRDLIYDEFVSPGSNGDYVISRLKQL